MRVDGKPANQLQEPSDGFINALEMGDPYSFPKNRRLLIIGYVFPIDSTMVEREGSCKRWLKTSNNIPFYWSGITDSSNGDMNLIQLEKVTERLHRFLLISIVENYLCQILCYTMPIIRYPLKLTLLY